MLAVVSIFLVCVHSVIFLSKKKSKNNFSFLILRAELFPSILFSFRNEFDDLLIKNKMEISWHFIGNLKHLLCSSCRMCAQTVAHNPKHKTHMQNGKKGMNGVVPSLSLCLCLRCCFRRNFVVHIRVFQFPF